MWYALFTRCLKSEGPIIFFSSLLFLPFVGVPLKMHGLQVAAHDNSVLQLIKSELKGCKKVYLLRVWKNIDQMQHSWSQKELVVCKYVLNGLILLNLLFFIASTYFRLYLWLVYYSRHTTFCENNPLPI